MLQHNIKNKCQELGLTIVQLEKLADIAPNTICRWQYRDKDGQVAGVMPAADRVARVANVLGTTSEELLRKDDEEVTESA